jgi:hypothetical protein
VDRHRFDADRDPDKTLHFDADTDPDSTKSRVQCGSVRVQCGSVGSALACCKAGPSSNLGSAPQGGSTH